MIPPLCPGADLLIDATFVPDSLGTTYQWNDLSTNNTYLNTLADTAWVTITNNGCTHTDSIIIDYYATDTSFLGNDTLFCFGTNVDIETNLYGAAYLWSDGFH